MSYHKDKDSSSLYQRFTSSTLLNETADDTSRLDDTYPATPHVHLTSSRTLNTCLTDIYLSFGRVDEDKTGDTKLKAAREALEAKYLFTATTESKWDPITFQNWRFHLRSLVLDHFSKFKAQNARSGLFVPKSFLEPSARSTILHDPNHPEHDHSAALLTVSDILSQHTYAPGPNYENDLLMHVMNARPDIAAGTRNDDV